jgi:hypothetical protein
MAFESAIATRKGSDVVERERTAGLSRIQRRLRGERCPVRAGHGQAA